MIRQDIRVTSSYLAAYSLFNVLYYKKIAPLLIQDIGVLRPQMLGVILSSAIHIFRAGLSTHYTEHKTTRVALDLTSLLLIGACSSLAQTSWKTCLVSSLFLGGIHIGIYRLLSVYLRLEKGPINPSSLPQEAERSSTPPRVVETKPSERKREVTERSLQERIRSRLEAVKAVALEAFKAPSGSSIYCVDAQIVVEIASIEALFSVDQAKETMAALPIQDRNSGYGADGIRNIIKVEAQSNPEQAKETAKSFQDNKEEARVDVEKAKETATLLQDKDVTYFEALVEIVKQEVHINLEKAKETARLIPVIDILHYHQAMLAIIQVEMSTHREIAIASLNALRADLQVTQLGVLLSGEDGHGFLLSLLKDMLKVDHLPSARLFYAPFFSELIKRAFSIDDLECQVSTLTEIAEVLALVDTDRTSHLLGHIAPLTRPLITKAKQSVASIVKHVGPQVDKDSRLSWQETLALSQSSDRPDFKMPETATESFDDFHKGIECLIEIIDVSNKIGNKTLAHTLFNEVREEIQTLLLLVKKEIAALSFQDSVKNKVFGKYFDDLRIVLLKATRQATLIDVQLVNPLIALVKPLILQKDFFSQNSSYSEKIVRIVMLMEASFDLTQARDSAKAFQTHFNYAQHLCYVAGKQAETSRAQALITLGEIERLVPEPQIISDRPADSILNIYDQLAVIKTMTLIEKGPSLADYLDHLTS